VSGVQIAGVVLLSVWAGYTGGSTAALMERDGASPWAQTAMIIGNALIIAISMYLLRGASV